MTRFLQALYCIARYFGGNGLKIWKFPRIYIDVDTDRASELPGIDE